MERERESPRCKGTGGSSTPSMADKRYNVAVSNSVTLEVSQISLTVTETGMTVTETGTV